MIFTMLNRNDAAAVRWGLLLIILSIRGIIVWGFESPSGGDIFCLKKRQHFHKNIRSYVENEWYCPRTVNILNVKLIQKYLYRQSQHSKTWDSKFWPWLLKLLEDSAWIRRFGVRVPPGRDIFCLKDFVTFTRTSVRVSKMNAVVRAQLTFQTLPLLQNVCLEIAIRACKRVTSTCSFLIYRGLLNFKG